MDWLERAKVWFGVVDPEDVAEEESAPRAELRVDPRRGDGSEPAGAGGRGRGTSTRRDLRGERPALDVFAGAPTESLEDCLVARERGDTAEMRRLLRELDRGLGLRTLLRAAAAMEAGDEAELAELLPRLARDEQSWRRTLQVAAALGEASDIAAACERAESLQAPKWAVAWTRALSPDASDRRRGLVELLVADPALARTVAARDLALEGCEEDYEAFERFAAFAHGRDMVRRFGPRSVESLLARIEARP